MRILIVASPRTGSSEICARLARYLKLKPYQEPFHENKNNRPYNLEDDSVVKCMIRQVPEGEDKYECVKFYKNYSKNFDKIILLLRKDVKAQIESFSFMMAQKGTGFKGNKRYVYVPQSNWPEAEASILLQNMLVRQLAGELLIPISYYEDMFSGDQGKLRLEDRSVL